MNKKLKRTVFIWKIYIFNTENGLALFLIARVMADAQIQSFGWGQNLITLYL